MNIEDIEARAKAATLGPWMLGWNKEITGPTVPASPAFCGEWRGRDEDDVRHVCVVVRNESLGEGLHCVVAAFPERAEGGDANAEFAAHAREDIPYLLAELMDRDEKLGAVREYSTELWGRLSGPVQRAVGERLDRTLKGGE